MNARPSQQSASQATARRRILICPEGPLGPNTMPGETVNRLRAAFESYGFEVLVQEGAAPVSSTALQTWTELVLTADLIIASESPLLTGAEKAGARVLAIPGPNRSEEFSQPHRFDRESFESLPCIGCDATMVCPATRLPTCLAQPGAERILLEAFDRLNLRLDQGTGSPRSGALNTPLELRKLDLKPYLAADFVRSRLIEPLLASPAREQIRGTLASLRNLAKTVRRKSSMGEKK